MSVANMPLSALMLGRRVVALALDLRVDLLLRDLPEVALVMAVLWSASLAAAEPPRLFRFS